LARGLGLRRVFITSEPSCEQLQDFIEASAPPRSL
jgi:hypothetical protein